jgi:hypothetical protein
MTKELILERKQVASTRIEELFAEINLYKGVVADCEYWLTTIEETKEKVSSNGKEAMKLTKVK